MHTHSPNKSQVAHWAMLGSVLPMNWEKLLYLCSWWDWTFWNTLPVSGCPVQNGCREIKQGPAEHSKDGEYARIHWFMDGNGGTRVCSAWIGR